jgi:hypothetical protein
MHIRKMIKTNDSAVSAVIGVILAVAIAVSISATAYAYVSGGYISVNSHSFVPIDFSSSSTGDITLLQAKSNTQMDDLEFHVNGYEIPNIYTGPASPGRTISVNYLIDNSEGYTLSDSGNSNVIITDRNTNTVIATYTIPGTVERILPPEEPRGFSFDPDPKDGATEQPLEFQWNVNIQNPNENLFNWEITCDGGYKIEGIKEKNGIKSIKLTDLKPGNTYTIIVAATDCVTGFSAKETYSFSTRKDKGNGDNKPVQFGKTDPEDKASKLPLSFTWSIFLSDPEQDLFTGYIKCSNNQYIEFHNEKEQVYALELTKLQPATEYKITVSATDEGSKQTVIQEYVFITGADTHGGDSQTSGSTGFG